MAKGSSTVVLCVDDDPMGLTTRSLVLSNSGYDVMTAVTGEAALRIFRRRKIDLVVIDHFLPDATGAQITTAMKQLKPEVLVVLFSGALDAPLGAEQADLFLSKGIDPPEFLAAVAKLLESRRLRRVK